MVNHKYKVIFTHIPKTAGSSITKFIKDGSQEISDHNYLQQDLNNKTKDYFKFTFVRNPWDRFVSNFFYFKKYGNNYPKDIIMGQTINKYDSFLDFIKDIHKLSKSDLPHPHFNRQITWLDPRIDFIGRFENLEEDFNFVAQQIGALNRQLPFVNKSNHRHYRDYYDNEARQIIARRYKKDIERFNYEF